MATRPTLLAVATLAASIGCASISPVARPGSSETELAIRPGAFSALNGTAFDDAVEFTNDIYSATCHPLYAVSGWSETAAGRRLTGSILAWVHRAHVTQGRVFLVPCEVASPFAASASQVSGHVNGSFFEATLTGRAPFARLFLRPLEIPEWSEFSAPAFCGRHVAYWSLKAGGELRAHVADLLAPRRPMTTSFGFVEVPASDNGWGVTPAVWSPACGAATFRSGTAARAIPVRK